MRPHGVSIAITRDPALVRTVRLVAAAVARRAGQDEEAVEEVRLAVGEACALIVGVEELPAANGDAPPTVSADDTVKVTMSIADRLRVEVSGEGGGSAPSSYGEVGVDPWALLRGLNDGLVVVHEGSTTAVSMSWPLS